MQPIISLVILFIAFPTSATAIAIQNPDCTIFGDADVYGPGVRWGFYLQWLAYVIFLFFYPEKANAARTATAITTLAVMINFYRNVHDKALISVEEPLLTHIALALIPANIPSSKEAWKKHGGSVALVWIIWAAFAISSPYILFDAWENGRQPGCDVFDFIYRPISVYSRGWLIAHKVLFLLAAICSGLLLFAAGIVLLYWFYGWLDLKVDRFSEKSNMLTKIQACISLVLGLHMIVFAEKIVHFNHITFPGTSITSSGQLISLLIGIFTLICALLSPLRALAEVIGKILEKDVLEVATKGEYSRV